jgi:hypothetical protein
VNPGPRAASRIGRSRQTNVPLDGCVSHQTSAASSCSASGARSRRGSRKAVALASVPDAPPTCAGRRHHAPEVERSDSSPRVRYARSGPSRIPSSGACRDGRRMGQALLAAQSDRERTKRHFRRRSREARGRARSRAGQRTRTLRQLRLKPDTTYEQQDKTCHLAQAEACARYIGL